MGKWLWRTILYLTNYLQYKPLGGNYEADFSVDPEYDTGSDFWRDYNNSSNSKYSYKWCLKWLKQHPNSNVWDELFMKDPYLKYCCEKKKIRSYDQLFWYSFDYWEKYKI